MSDTHHMGAKNDALVRTRPTTVRIRKTRARCCCSGLLKFPLAYFLAVRAGHCSRDM